MDLVAFEDLLDRLGHDMSSWPVEEQREALLLLAHSDAAEELLREARAMGALLAHPAVRAPAGLTNRIMAQARREAPVRKEPEKRPLFQGVLRSFWPTRPAWRVAFVSACFVVGLFCGIFHNMTRLDRNEVDFHDFVASVVDITYFRD
jgi:hypothetical protein